MADRRQVLVTGGAGFIGSHTVLELHAAGYEPILLDDYRNSNPGIVDALAELVGESLTCHAVDCSDPAAVLEVFRLQRIEAVIHFAANKAVGESVSNPLLYYQNNLGSLISVLRAMETHGVKDLVFSSSCTVYGEPEQLPVRESSPLGAPASPYGRTKAVCESIIQEVVAAGASVRAMILRYFNPIGAHPSGRIGELPRGVPSNLVPFLTQAAAGLRDRLTVFGDDYDTRDGTCIRDYIHVVDLARAHVASLSWLAKEAQTPTVEILNVGTGAGSSVLEVIRAFEAETGTDVPYIVGTRRPGDITEIYAAVDRCTALLGWTATKSLGDAMRDAWRWQQQFPGNGF